MAEMRTEEIPPFFRLPLELRIEIYRCLFWRGTGGLGIPDAFSPYFMENPISPYSMENLMPFGPWPPPLETPAMSSPVEDLDPCRTIPSSRPGNFGSLLAMMRTNRQIYVETVAVLYEVKFAFHPGLLSVNGEWNMRFLRGDGPARFLRQVVIDLPPFNYLRTAWPPARERDWGFKSGELYHESILQALARNARQLEVLELESPYESPFYQLTSSWEIRGLPSLKNVDNSWVDPPLPYLSPCARFRQDPQYSPPPLFEEHLPPILELLAPGDGALQAKIREKLEDAYLNLYRPPVVGGLNFWVLIWNALWHFDPQKTFWGGTIMGILKSFGPSLRVIRLVGRVDAKWMTAVANLTGVTVEAKKARTDLEWVVVEPRERA